jgi:hypothetical protein
LLLLHRNTENWMQSSHLLVLSRTTQPLSELFYLSASVREITFWGSYPADRAKRLFDVNVHGVFYTAREAARNMIPNGGGSIILISSMSANVCVKKIIFRLLPVILTICWDREYTSGILGRIRMIYALLQNFQAASSLQCIQGGRQASGCEPCGRMGSPRSSGQYIEVRTPKA